MSLSETMDKSPDSVNSSELDYSTIFKRNLFKSEVDSSSKTKEINVKNLDKTDLHLKLWGTVTGKHTLAFAVIENEKKIQGLYKEGDSIEGATLRMILKDKVILRSKGKDEILEMQDRPQLVKAEISKASSSLMQKASKAFLATQNITERPPQTRKIVLNRSEIDAAVSDIGSMMTQVKISPYFIEGKANTAGLRLSGIQSGSIFQKMGLVNGDVILGVEGQQIESLDDAMTFYDSMLSQDSVTLKVRRRGRINDIEYLIE
jgi:general secretion pathway protein C